MTTFTPCLLIHWLTMLSVPRLFLKELRKGNFFIAVKGQKYRLYSPFPNIPLKFSEVQTQFFFFSKSIFTVHGHSFKICNDSRFHFTLEVFSTSSLFSLIDIYLNYNLLSNSTSLLKNSPINIQGIKTWLRTKRSKRVKSCL